MAVSANTRKYSGVLKLRTLANCVNAHPYFKYVILADMQSHSKVIEFF
jgi:hypothetical protein